MLVPRILHHRDQRRGDYNEGTGIGEVRGVTSRGSTGIHHGDRPSEQITRRARDELELPSIDMDETLGEHFFNDDDEDDIPVEVDDTDDTPSTYVPEIGTKINREFTKGVFRRGGM